MTFHLILVSFHQLSRIVGRIRAHFVKHLNKNVYRDCSCNWLHETKPHPAAALLIKLQ